MRNLSVFFLHNICKFRYNIVKYEKLDDLNEKVKNETTSIEEKDMLMAMLYGNRAMTEKQYNDI